MPIFIKFDKAHLISKIKLSKLKQKKSCTAINCINYLWCKQLCMGKCATNDTQIFLDSLD